MVEMTNGRGIGPVGTALRVVTGVGLVYLAVGAVGPSGWRDVEWYDPVVGFAMLPAIALLLGLAAQRLVGRPVRSPARWEWRRTWS
jgi:hypothetical protein